MREPDYLPPRRILRIATSIAPQAVMPARATLVTSTMGTTLTPSGPMTMVATGRPIEPPPPPMPPPPTSWTPGPGAAAWAGALLGPKPLPNPSPPPTLTSLAVMTVYWPDTTGGLYTAPGWAAEKSLSRIREPC